jgi:hypothetical protein
MMEINVRGSRKVSKSRLRQDFASSQPYSAGSSDIEVTPSAALTPVCT